MQSHSPLILPRGLIFFAAVWLIASIALAMGFRTPVHATAASLEPGIRLMLQCIVIGLMIGWPLLRLSQPVVERPVGQTLLDAIALLTILQIIVWVPRVFTTWSVERTAAMDAMLVSWTMIVAAIVAAAIGTDRPLARTGAMLACVLITLLGPLLILIGAPWMRGGGVDLISLGPFLGVAHLAEGGATRPWPAQWQAIIVLGAAATASWLALSAALIAKRMARP